MTRLPVHGRYERILVPTDFSSDSLVAARVAAAFQGEAQLEFIHAISTRDEAKLRSAEASEQVVLAYRKRCLEYAQERMLEFTRTLAMHDNPKIITKLSRGDRGLQTAKHQERSGADLVVVGTKRRSAWRDVLLGSTAHRILRWASSDVLLVPGPAAGDPQMSSHRSWAVEAGPSVLDLRSAERRAS